MVHMVKMVKMQDSDDNKLAAAQILNTLYKIGKYISYWLMILLQGWELTGLPIEHNNLVVENHNEHLSDIG